MDKKFGGCLFYGLMSLSTDNDYSNYQHIYNMIQEEKDEDDKFFSEIARKHHINIWLGSDKDGNDVISFMSALFFADQKEYYDIGNVILRKDIFNNNLKDSLLRFFYDLNIAIDIDKLSWYLTDDINLIDNSVITIDDKSVQTNG